MVICIECSGCAYWFLAAPPPEQYVLDMGGPDVIAKWTLQQNKIHTLMDGMGALELLAAYGSDRVEAQEASKDLAHVFSTIEGWRSDRVFIKDPNTNWPDRTTNVELIHKMMYIVADDAVECPRAEILLYELKPDDEHAQWSVVWNGAVERMIQERRHLTRRYEEQGTALPDGCK